MSARPLFLLLCLAVATAGVLRARSQPDSNGFISIDCGLPGPASSVDRDTELPYSPDAGFTDAGSNHDVSVEYTYSRLWKLYYNVRSFPDGERNCYTLRSLVPGIKYLFFRNGDLPRLLHHDDAHGHLFKKVPQSMVYNSRITED
ncbi:hypothetical protein QYE76_015942 [Lolium multiflorum]|uniref:Malectin-like domain-containing protein n=1 Tax=Lolium multiflorum TaxID=4521 RepID=A0AAD8X875_LOLMU|nr:hypothetical protein QYE76_015942 [Lolium multiflorum]